MAEDPHQFAQRLLDEMNTPAPEPARLGLTATDLAWSTFLRERKAFHLWLSRIDPALPAGFYLDTDKPEPFTLGAVNALLDEMRGAMMAGLETYYQGDRYAAWRAIGEPPVLRHWAGLAPAPLSEKDHAIEMWFESGEGRRPVSRGPDGRSRAVIEEATGTIWPSIAAAADDIGTSANYMSQHLNGRVKFVKGRKFRYAE